MESTFVEVLVLNGLRGGCFYKVVTQAWTGDFGGVLGTARGRRMACRSTDRIVPQSTLEEYHIGTSCQV